MSDDDDFGFLDDPDADVDYGENMEDTGFEIENQYYEAKELARDNLESALECFQTIILTEETKGKWGFKSLKRIVKINHQLGRPEDVFEKYKELMTYTDKAVTMNEAEKSINSLIDFLSSSPVINKIYELTLQAFKTAKNEKALLRLQLRVAKALLESKDYSNLEKNLKELHDSCKNDVSKASQFMEVLALEILMHSDRGNTRQLKDLYEKASEIKSAINVPNITAIINECGGKMYMREKNWKKAYRDLFQAFKDYDEVGNRKALQCLKYLVLASMLSSLRLIHSMIPVPKLSKIKKKLRRL
jgi:COP9 signalosome complex subunit 2